MSPSTANLDYQGNTRRTVGMDLQRSEFEDFMNAYRPNLDMSRREQKSGTSSASSEDPKVDLGRSIKRLIKKTQTSSPSLHQKNRREGIQRTSETHERERSATNELKPPPVPSQEKRARRPYSVHLDGSGQSTPSHEGKPRIEHSPVRVIPEHNPPPPHSVKNGRSKPERSSASRDAEQQPPPKPKISEATSTTKNGSKPKAEKPPLPRAEPQVQVKVASPETAASPVVIQSSAPIPVNGKKKTSVKSDSTISSGAELKISSSLEHLSPHCLVIPGNMLNRYLPPKHNPDPLLSLRVIQVPERKYHIILEFQESPTYERPHTSASGLLMVAEEDDVICTRDQWTAFEWLRESHVALNGMLLQNVEKITEFPYVTYLVVGGNKNDLCNKMVHLKQRPFPIHRQQLHFVAGYEETVTVATPPVSQVPEQPTSDRAGYVISLYQVNATEDGLRFEQNWVTWTGARQLYSHVPEWMGLKRISIHKSVVPTKVISYALICEFSSIMDYVTDACVLVDQLRARCCGFIGIYRILDAF